MSLPDLSIHGLISKTELSDSAKAICLHGWLDNAASFEPLMPCLPELECAAIDLPGHGKSDHLENSVPYTIAVAAHYVLCITEALGWNKFHIIGHSLGGNIAPLVAVAAPERVRSLILIDAFGPIAEPASALPNRLKRFHDEMNARVNSKARVFTDIESAVGSRLMATKMTEASARLIVRRQLLGGNGEYRWAFDPKLRVASPSYFTEEQVQSILKALECPVLSIVAKEGYLHKHRDYPDRANCIDSLSSIELSGNHHLHMDTPGPVAATINEFLELLNRETP